MRTIGYTTTNQKRAQDKLVEAQDFLQKMFNLCPVAKTLTRGSDRVIVDVSESVENLFGYTREELVGQTIGSFDYWLDPGERQRATQINLTQGFLRDFEFAYKTRTGRTGWATINTEIIEQQGERYTLIEFILARVSGW